MPATVDLFADDRDLPLFIVTDAPATTCNYRCPYCSYFRSGEVLATLPMYEADFERWVRALRTALTRIRRPLYLCMGPQGEALEVPGWWPVFREALSFPSVRMAAFVSNLSKPMAPFVEGLDCSRIGVTASIHPTQWRSAEQGLAFFTEQVLYLRNAGVKIIVNYVLTPYQLRDFPSYRRHFEALGIPVTCNVFRGEHKGKLYPEAFDDESLALMREYMAELPSVFDYQSRRLSPFGVACTAAQHAINLKTDGSVFPCYFADHRLGSIYDERLPIYDEPFTCTASQCICKWSIPLMVDNVRDYVCVGNIHQILRRPAGQVGTHPFL